MRPDALAAQVVKGLLKRTDLDPALLEDVILGCAYPEAAQGNNLARIVGLLAGLPHEVGGMTVNRFCGSSMQAVHIAAAQIEAGMGEAFLCVGVESMTMVPQGGFNFSPNPELKANTDAYISMGETAENVAQRWNVSRADQEAWRCSRTRRPPPRARQGRLARRDRADPRWPRVKPISADGCIRPGTSLEALAGLKPAFRPDGVVTAGTSSPLTDGAAAVLVTSDAFAAKHGLQTLARIRSFATVGVDPAVMGIGPIPATRKALARAGLDGGATSTWSRSTKPSRRRRWPASATSASTRRPSTSTAAAWPSATRSAPPARASPARRRRCWCARRAAMRWPRNASAAGRASPPCSSGSEPLATQ